jgi:hypothetical protein
VRREADRSPPSRAELKHGGAIPSSTARVHSVVRLPTVNIFPDLVAGGWEQTHRILYIMYIIGTLIYLDTKTVTNWGNVNFVFPPPNIILHIIF